MAYTGNDPYEEAKLKAKLNRTGVKNTSTSVGPNVPYGKYDVNQEPTKYYAPLNVYEYSDLVEIDEETGEEKVVRSPNAPAELTDIPTSTTNVSRPRTVAAGYDKEREVLTVVFRDGTVWNYDNVTPGEWQNFSASISKGRPWINEFKFGVGQLADMSSENPELEATVQAQLYQRGRTSQLAYQSKYRYKVVEGKPATKKLGKAAAKRAQKALRNPAPKRGGANPSNGGKNPSK